MAKRDKGIDLLRIVLMFMIVVGHMFTHTNIRTLTDTFSTKWFFIWFIQTITICSVDCYVLISGYYGCNSKFHMNKIMSLWGKTVFYSVVITVVLLLIKAVTVSSGLVLNAFFPVLREEYWFITTYILLYVFTPFLNRLLDSLNRVQLNVLCILIILIFYFEPIFSVIFFQVDSSEGFGIIGFVTLYLVGAIIRKNEINPTKKTCGIVLIMNSIIMLGSKVLLTFFIQLWNVNLGTSLMYHYNTVFVLMNSISLLFLFKGIKLPKLIEKILVMTTPSVLAVYLLHEKPVLRSLLWNASFTEMLKNASLPTFCIITIFVGIMIVALGIITDQLLERYLFSVFRRTKLHYKMDTLCIKYDQLINNEDIINESKS